MEEDTIQTPVDTWEPAVKEVYRFQEPITKDLKLRPVYGKPDKPSLAYLMYLLRYHPTKAKEIYPVGTELPDTEWFYNNPWIIVHYQEQEYYKNDIPHIGLTAILMRKYASYSSFATTAWGTANYSYNNTAMKTYANTTYPTQLISKPYQEAACQTWITLNSTPSAVVKQKLTGFIPSLTNVNATDSLIRPQGIPQDEVWEYFQGNNPNPHDTADSRRTCYYVHAQTSLCNWLLRSDCTQSAVGGTSGTAGNYYAYVGTQGTFGQDYQANNTGVVARFCITVAPDLSTPDTIDYLYEALLNEDTLYYPIGRALVDENDPGNPWQVSHYCPARLSNGEIRNGCWLTKKYALTDMSPFDEDKSTDYTKSTLQDRMNGEVWENFADDVKDKAAEVQVPRWDGEKMTFFNAKVRPLSATEFLGQGTAYEGEAFELWRQLTATQQPNNAALAKRIITNEAKTAANIWTYSWYNADYVWGDLTTGAITAFTGGLLQLCSVYPTIFIPGALSKQIPAETFFEDLDNLEEEELREKYPLGSEITDDYDIGNPWLVMHYGNATDAEGNEKIGVYLRKKAHISQVAYSPSKLFNYATSAMPAYMNTYLGNRPQVWQDRITQISVPFFDGSAMANINASIWLMSATEMMGTGQREEGFAFDYYKEVRGIEEPIAQNVVNTNLVETMPNSPTAVRYWTRSGRNTSSALYVAATGQIASVSDTSAATFGVLPACFVAKKTEEEITEE